MIWTREKSSSTRHKGVYQTYLLNEGAYQTGQATRSYSSLLIEELCPTYVTCVINVFIHIALCLIVKRENKNCYKKYRNK